MAVPAARVVFTESDRAAIGARVSAALSSGMLTLGENTRELEAATAAAHDVPFAVAVSSGTAALEIILRSVGVAGREVVVPANTFAATAFAVIKAGATPVYADVDAETFALGVDTVTARLTANTAAVVLVHIGGLITPETQALAALCAERGIPLVEDAAHAHGCSYAGTSAGRFGIAGALSFYPTKVVTSGEGGMVLTADERIRDEARIHRDQGKAGFLSNLHVREGYAWRMSELHAAVGVVHLGHLAEFIDRRQQVAARYSAALDRVDWARPVLPPAGAVSNHYKYMVLLDEHLDRTELKAQLRERFEVGMAGEVYDTPLHAQPALHRFATGPLPVAEEVCARHVCLPVHSDMTTEEVDSVIAAFTAVGDELRARA